MYDKILPIDHLQLDLILKVHLPETYKNGKLIILL